MAEVVFDAVGKLLIIYLVFIFPATLALLAYAHLFAPKKLREDLLREPYFSDKELARLAPFPFSLLKTLALVRGVAAPSTMRRRFGSYDFAGKVPSHFRRICQLLVLLVIAGACVCVATAIGGVMLDFA